MGIESTARNWAHRHGLQDSRAVVAAYRGFSRVRFRRAWDDDVAFRGHRFEVGRDLSLYPAVRNGGFEAEELDAFLPQVPADAVVWDVGANVGIYAVLLAAAAPQGHVVAFEPVPDSHQRLVRNVAKNGLSNITVHRLALSNRKGTAGMAVHPDAHGCDAIGEVTAGTQAIEVDTVTGDEFVTTSGLGDPDVVKVDIEGHEPEFLEGAWQVFSRRRPLLMMEVNPTTWTEPARVEQWQGTLDRLFDLYGSGLWFDGGVRSSVERVDAAALDRHRAFTLLLGGAKRA